MTNKEKLFYKKLKDDRKWYFNNFLKIKKNSNACRNAKKCMLIVYVLRNIVQYTYFIKLY